MEKGKFYPLSLKYYDVLSQVTDSPGFLRDFNLQIVAYCDNPESYNRSEAKVGLIVGEYFQTIDAFTRQL